MLSIHAKTIHPQKYGAAFSGSGSFSGSIYLFFFLHQNILGISSSVPEYLRKCLSPGNAKHHFGTRQCKAALQTGILPAGLKSGISPRAHQQKTEIREATFLIFNWRCQISGSSILTHISVFHEHTNYRARGYATKVEESRELGGGAAIPVS